jgi:AcrR family transcriptional regulator
LYRLVKHGGEGLTRKRRVLPPDERKREILEAATEVFSAKGYRVASVNDILERAGIARGTFYHYFNSKKDAFLELIEFYFSEFETVLEQCHDALISSLDGGKNVFDTWRDYALGVFRFHRENPKLTLLIYREAMSLDEHFSFRVDELSDLGTKWIARDLDEMVHRGLIRQCDTSLIATIITGATVFLTLEYIVRRGTDDLETLASELAMNQVKALAPIELFLQPEAGV